LTLSTILWTSSTFLYIWHMMDTYVNEFRSFTRFYTAYIGILNKYFMDSEYSLPQTRVMHAINTQHGITPSEITAMLNIDKSYLSRILINFEKKKLISKKLSVSDGRVVNLYLTKSGIREFSAVDKAFNHQVEKILLRLNETERKNVIKWMKQIKETLSRATSNQ
jgi:DNA-binding MarR family transcriptional regulator